MKKIASNIIKCLAIVISLPWLATCTPGEGIDPVETNEALLYGRIQLDFPVDDAHVPQRCIKRADLSISYTADSLYRKEFITVVNVSDYRHLYEVALEPGTYYYQAGKTCICGRDTCLWGGYPGGQNGMVWTMGSFEITSGKIIYNRIKFD
jgi:hypothetical protein